MSATPRSPFSPQQPGLELVIPDHGPEVLIHQVYPEVVDVQTPTRRRRHEGLEPVHTAQGQFLAKKASYHQSHLSRSSYGSHGIDGEVAPDADRGLLFYPSQNPVKRERRLCGMRRRTAFIVLAVVLVVVISGAVLGGVLGIVLPKEDKKTTSPFLDTSVPAQQNSGLALLPDTTGSAYLFYQHQGFNGGIVVTSLASTDPSTLGHMVTTEAAPGSPIVAVQYTQTGVTTRQLYYIDTSQNVKTVYSTASNLIGWSNPASIIPSANADGLRAAPTSSVVGLTACADTSPIGLNGIRVYYGTQAGYVQEIGKDFTSNGSWTAWATFDGQGGGSDAFSGLSCVSTSTTGHLYMRNTTSRALVQWSWNYGTKGPWSQSTCGPPFTLPLWIPCPRWCGLS